MNSLLEKEGMAGKVQTVYFDPPYGIKYGSNFQPFVNKCDVQDGKDEDLSAEPETIQAFRDTWELGIHSYLTYLRDRLLLARELLADGGSCFVQISDENVHRVRMIMDEVFGAENFVRLISFTKTGSMVSNFLGRTGDYLIWYGKRRDGIKYNQLFLSKNPDNFYCNVELPSGKTRKVLKAEMSDMSLLPEGAKIFQLVSLESAGPANVDTPLEFEGEIFRPNNNRHWSLAYPEGMEALKSSGRMIKDGKKLRWKYYIDDYPLKVLSEIWTDTSGFNPDQKYVVETRAKVVQRCLLMTTDPGDLVLDITCGSGTTAAVAEQWGRRWITCDTSRVALTLAKQRLLTAYFDYYQLAYPTEGVGSSFIYKTVPHITLKSIANNEPPASETLYDQPRKDSTRARVTGPFTVEAVPAPYAKSFDDLEGNDTASDTSVARSGETLRQSEWRDELLRTGVRAKNGTMIRFSRVEVMSGTKFIQAEAETQADVPQKVLAVFGPEHAPLERRTVENAWQEARPFQPDILLFCAFQFDEEAAKDIDELTPDKAGMQLLKAQMNADLLTDDLRKKRTHNQSFWLVGQPDVKVESGQWLVDSETNEIWTNYECFKKFSGLDRLAEIEGLGREDLCFYLALSEARDLWHDLANEAGCRVGSLEHSRRAGKERQGGVQTVFGHSQRVDGGMGDLNGIVTGFESIDKGGFGNFVEGLRRNSKITERVARIAKVMAGDRWSVHGKDKRSTNYYPLTTKTYSQVEVLGFDYYNPKTGEVESGGKNNIAMWLLDTDYDGRSLFPSQVFFPMAGAKDGWAKLAKNLQAEIDAEKIEAFQGTVSLAFEPGDTVAVKIVDDRGIESLRVLKT